MVGHAAGALVAAGAQRDLGRNKDGRRSSRQGLKDADPLVRQGAAQGMIASDNPTMSLELVEFVPDEKETQVRKTMLQSLSHARNTNDAFTKAANKLAAQTSSDETMIPEVLAFAPICPRSRRNLRRRC